MRTFFIIVGLMGFIGFSQNIAAANSSTNTLAGPFAVLSGERASLGSNPTRQGSSSGPREPRYARY